MNKGMNKPYFTLWIEYYSTLKKKKKKKHHTIDAYFNLDEFQENYAKWKKKKANLKIIHMGIIPFIPRS